MAPGGFSDKQLRGKIYMKLGIIAPVAEESFQKARDLGLDFVEFCINGTDHGERLLTLQSDICGWIKKYGVAVGSIGRWKAEVLKPDGTVDPEEIRIAKALEQVSADLDCPNYICGCNYRSGQSLFSNYCRAVEFLEQVLNNAPSGVKISLYNCRKMNFLNTEEAWQICLGHFPELGIKFDPSHSRYAGTDYLQEATQWGHRIYHVHLKGSLIVNGQRIDDPPAGLDQTDWPTLLNILRAKGYNRNLSIEPHSPVWQGELGEKGIAYSVRYFRELLL